MDPLASRMLGRYQLEGLLGRGGMASVYRASDPMFERVVAVKVLSPQLSSDQQYKDRFQREARSMARLQHPHILPVYDVGEQDGTVFLVMQYVDGGSLHDQFAAQRRAGQLRFSKVLAILEPVADALDYAHRRGVVHRDVKPQNILLTEQGYPYLTDFGIAKVLNQDPNTPAITMANAVIGTPEYMSPEQAQGLPLDGRADLYSVGVILYELCTGRTPFRAETATDTPISILIRHAGTPPPIPSGINPQIGSALEAVLLRALAKRPDERYPTGAALFGALREALAAPYRMTSLLELPAAPMPEIKLPSLPDLTPPAGNSPATAPPYIATATPPPARSAEWHDVPSYPTLAPAPSWGGQATGGAVPVATPPPSVPMPVPPATPPSRSRTPLFVIAGGVILALLVLSALIARATVFGGDEVATTSVGAANTPTVTAGVIGGGGGTATVAGTTPTPPGTATTGPTVPPVAVVTTPTRTPSAGTGGPATPGPASPQAVGPREVILFSSHRNDVHDSQIYIMNPDGSGQRQLTFTRGHSWGPRISPDGKYFIFSSVAPGEHVDHSATGGGRVGTGHHEIFRANADGSNIVRLTNTTSWNNAWAWAPDSKSVILASDRDGNWELYRMSVNGEQDGITRLTNNPAQDGWPSFTPDGKQVVFASDREGGTSQLYIMDADGKNVKRLNFSEAYDTLPDISPDGKHIVYSQQSGTEQTGITSEIFVVDIDGKNATRLTSTVAVNTDPSWSPNGKQIVFSSDRDGQTNIYVMNADGSGLKRLTNEAGEDVTAFWGFIQISGATPQPVANPFVMPLAQEAVLPTTENRQRKARKKYEVRS